MSENVTLARLLKPEHIILDFDAKNKEDFFDKVVDIFVEKGILSSKDELKKALLEREKLGSTAIGNGIALPHARTKGVNDLFVGFVRTKNKIDFEAIDRMPVDLFFILFAPIDKSVIYLKLLVKLSRFLQREDILKNLRAARKPEEVVELISNLEEAAV